MNIIIFGIVGNFYYSTIIGAIIYTIISIPILLLDVFFSEYNCNIFSNINIFLLGNDCAKHASFLWIIIYVIIFCVVTIYNVLDFFTQKKEIK